MVSGPPSGLPFLLPGSVERPLSLPPHEPVDSNVLAPPGPARIGEVPKKKAKPQQIPTGLWSKLNYDAIARAEIMMMRVTADMRDSWGVKSEELTLERLQRDKFLAMLEAVDGDEDASRQLNEKLSRLLIPLIQQAMMPAPEAPR